MMRCWLIGFVLVASTVAAENVEIDVVALYKDAALFEINGQRKLLRIGERSPEGIRLVRAHSREAVIELGGTEMSLNLSSRIGTEFKPQLGTSVSIALSDVGQYRTTGSINDRPVAFVVDTGANIMAMNSHHAEMIGINYERSGTQARVQTAGGVVNSWEVKLDMVQIGDIKVRNVRAAVLEGDFPADILLGMTFLSNVEIKEGAGVLVLKSKL